MRKNTHVARQGSTITTQTVLRYHGPGGCALPALLYISGCAPNASSRALKFYLQFGLLSTVICTLAKRYGPELHKSRAVIFIPCTISGDFRAATSVFQRCWTVVSGNPFPETSSASRFVSSDVQSGPSAYPPVGGGAVSAGAPGGGGIPGGIGAPPSPGGPPGPGGIMPPGPTSGAAGGLLIYHHAPATTARTTSMTMTTVTGLKSDFIPTLLNEHTS